MRWSGCETWFDPDGLGSVVVNVIAARFEVCSVTVGYLAVILFGSEGRRSTRPAETLSTRPLALYIGSVVAGVFFLSIR